MLFRDYEIDDSLTTRTSKQRKDRNLAVITLHCESITPVRIWQSHPTLKIVVMNEDDEAAALLAELLAISYKSTETRFDGGDVDDVNDSSPSIDEKNSESHQSPSRSPVTNRNPGPASQSLKQNGSSSKLRTDVPPWKRKSNPSSSRSTSVEVDVDVVTSTPQVQSSATKENNQSSTITSDLTGTQTLGGNFRQAPSTFQGDRGGDAHDEELLALLRGVSAKSGAADRFSGVDTDDQAMGHLVQSSKPTVQATAKPTISVKKASRESTNVPPWKRANAKPAQSTASGDADVVVVAANPPPRNQSSQSKPTPSASGGGFRQESTFQGDRGGDAHDEELLALLRGVSAKSAGTDRFASTDEADQSLQLSTDEAAAQNFSDTGPHRKTGKEASEQPPLNGEKGQVDRSSEGTRSGLTEVEHEETPFVQTAAVGGVGNFKKESTFQGERGGDANDEELLALLRGVSAKSGGADRFSDDVTGSEPPTAAQITTKATNNDKPRKSWKFSPPWKKKQQPLEPRKEEPSQESKTLGLRSAMDVAVAEVEEDEELNKIPINGGGGNFKQESTFQGERGGDAHDEELLALLRGVSSKSGGANRFEINRGVEDVSKSSEEHASQATQSKHASSGTPLPISHPVPKASPTAMSDDQEDIVVTKENLPSALFDSNWKVRKEAYRVLSDVIRNAAGKTAPGTLDADTIVPGLDNMVTKLVSDKNATALEFAVQAVTDYADACKGGSSSERAQTIVAALIAGNGFTSPRPTSAQAASALVLKLMEVGSDPSSVTAVISLLVNQGLGSKKPKVVQLSASLILEATYSFGACCLPLAAIVSALPKVLTHSNKGIRDCGLEIVAEFCRALGSREPMEDVIAKMQKSQAKDLDFLLAKQASPTKIKTGLRCQRVKGGSLVPSAADALFALQAGGAELEKERFAKRPAINLMDAISQTEYSSKLKLAKWSEKVGALDIVLKCGGEKPYKLEQPSSSNNYTPLISEMKGLLTHTHFAVVSKSMDVLAMLAQGVGEKLYPFLRPLFPKLLQLSKDKKLTNGVSGCLDAFFGNVLTYEHLLDPDSALPDATNEAKEKNALARTTALEFLARCIVRGSSAGPRANLTRSNALSCANFIAQKLDDSDANVRKSALNALTSLLKVDDCEIQQSVATVVDGLKQSNPRAYKSLTASIPSTVTDKSKRQSPSKNSSVVHADSSPKKPIQIDNSRAAPVPPSSAPIGTSKRDSQTLSRTDRGKSSEAVCADDVDVPSLEDAVARCESMAIPLWAEAEEDEGVLSGLESIKWQFRQGAIRSLAQFVSTRPMLDSHSEIERDSVCLLTLVKEHTRDFKETNMNVARSIMELFLAICDYHENAECPLPKWAIVDGTSLALEKISDRKLSALSKSLLMSFCVVHPTHVVLVSAYEIAGKLKSPSAHEEFLVWMKTFCREFGSASIGQGMSNTISFLKDESGSKNIKVKRAALSVLGVMHTHLGPSFKASVLASSKEPSFREDVEATFSEHPFDSAAAKIVWAKRCICGHSQNGGNSNESGGALDMNLPKLDLFAELPSDCLSRMGSKEGKTSWKARKEALEDVEKALQANPGVLDTSNLRALIDLLRAMRERLSDSQSNLKPLAARLIGAILGSVEGDAQGKLGKVVYAPLINAAMNDSRKIMHDASMEALVVGTSIPTLKGEGPNEQSLEAYIVALTGELEESEFKASGIAEVLSLTQSFTTLLPDLDKVASQRGETLGSRFSRVLVDALTSSKAEIRSASESLISACLKANVFSMQTVKKCTGRLVPAKQRSVGLVLAKLSSETHDEIAPSAPANEPADAANTSSLKFEKIPMPATVSNSAPKAKHHVLDERNNNDHGARSRLVKPNHQSDEDRISSVTNPLVHESGPSGAQKSAAAMRSLTWPEFPEEPSGSSLYNGLKKAWAPIIPADSLKMLFPDGGIRKQDDAKCGFDLLVRAVVMDRAGEGMAVTEQLAFILRWSVFVLCSKESTVGLTGLLDMLSTLVSYLKEMHYEFSDSETMVFAPFLFEKASIAKGRFKDTYVDLITAIKSSDLLPAKRLGPFVCVALMEGSSQPKARLMACQECSVCVEAIGLSGIGKKGVLAAAKALSDEKLPENRAAFLDLMVLLVSRMHNDMQRLSKICGSSLSPKARALIEERLAKSDRSATHPSPAKDASPSKATNSTTDLAHKDGTSNRTSRLPRSTLSTPVSKLPVSKQRSIDNLETGFLAEEFPPSFQDELPALDLRAGQLGTPHDNRGTPNRPSDLLRPTIPSSLPRLDHGTQYSSQSDRMIAMSSYSPQDLPSPVVGSTSAVSNPDQVATHLFSASSEETSDQSAFSMGSSIIAGSNESLGAAASLRARLLKIREKNKGISEAPSTSQPPEPFCSPVERSIGHQNAQLQADPYSSLKSDGKLEVVNPVNADMQFSFAEPVLEKCILSIKSLLQKSKPLLETDETIMACTDVLKNIHAAVSKQENLAVGLAETTVARLRDEIKDSISDLVRILTQLIDFGFNCHTTNHNSGMSVPLLSVNLASLMAIFRSSDLATLVAVDDLTVLIKEAGKALLDPRLAPPSKSVEGTQLDEATSTQLVRAINKLAVQAATGAKRENSIQALVTLQEQLSLNIDACEDPLFNSRLSRVVTKLLTRVLKAEESTSDPFLSPTMDIEAVLCCLEDALVACDKAEDSGNAEGAASTRNVAKLVVTAVLNSRGEASTLLDEMANLDIDPSASALGKLVSSVCTALGIDSNPSRGSSASTLPIQKDVALLVSAIGSSTQGSDRDQAIAALKHHTALHGDEELNNHLKDVSAAFRAFILEQLSEERQQASPTNSSSMSERIKSLRSKLNATEAAVQSVVSVENGGHQQTLGSGSDLSNRSHEDDSAQEAPPPKPSVKAFRDRLAAAQERRDATTFATAEVTSPVPQTTAGNRAAALRARLQAVKMKQTN